MVSVQPSAGNAITLRVLIKNVPGQLGKLSTAIGEAGGDIGAIDLVAHQGDSVVRQIDVKCRDEAHADEIVAAARTVAGVEVLEATDRTFELHRGGKIGITGKFPLRSRDDLSMAYTPGVGRVCEAIARDPHRVWELTIKQNSVAVLTDGTAVLGLGNLGPEAAMPVMEGKAMLFKEFGGIDAYPICVRAESTEHLISVAKAVAPGFGGINLEDIAAPACFEVEERLRAELDIPVFHDDQHGTAVVTQAALLNAARVVGRPLSEMRVVILGMGAAGVACARLLLHMGVGDVVGVDSAGVLHKGRTKNMNSQKQWLADNTNRENLTGDLEAALRGADAFIGVSGPGLVRPEWIATMRSNAIVFALANPIPEIMPEEMPENVRIIATGRSDYANQINNVLVFPGFFRGLLDGHATTLNHEMEASAARALAGLVGGGELSEDYIIPSVFDRRVAPAVADAVLTSAIATGAARGDESMVPGRGDG